MAEFYVYIHCRPDGEPFYVGKGSSGSGHSRRSHDFKFGRNRYYKRVLAKHGAENIQVLLFPMSSEEVAFEHEIFWIHLLRQVGCTLTNITDGGEGLTGVVTSEETLAKRSAAMKGRTLTPEHKDKIRQSLLGKKHSVERCANISAGKIGVKPKPFSDEHKANLAKSKLGNQYTKGRKHTDAAKEKIGAAKRGIQRSEETINKWRESRKGYKISEESRAKLAAAVKESWRRRKSII